jgi:hypothetical protein
MPIPGGGNLVISLRKLEPKLAYPGKGGGIPLGGNPGKAPGGGNGLAPGC